MDDIKIRDPKGRHPYTYAADFMRVHGPKGEEVMPGIWSSGMSRGDASVLMGRVAEAIGMDKHELAVRLSFAYQQERNEEDARFEATAQQDDIMRRLADR